MNFHLRQLYCEATMPYHDETIFWLGLKATLHFKDQTFLALLKAFGSPEQIYTTSAFKLRQVVSPEIAAEISQGVPKQRLCHILDWLEAPDNHLVTLGDAHYPQHLLEISTPPPVFFAKGDLARLKQPCIAIVGSRNASIQGEKNTLAFAHDLAQQGLCIVSGMALGIDGAAHRGAMSAQGGTIAVVSTGLDIVYPTRHRELAHQIVAQKGLMISEFPLGVSARPQHFPRRNRIISGLSLGVLVVEANLGSGSQITARFAAEQGREVFAIPGSIHSPLSKGCHQLIKQGAKLVDCTQDILEELHLQLPALAAPSVVSTANQAHPLLAFMSYDAMSLDELVQQTGLSSGEISAMLMVLELEGKVVSVVGGKYQRLA